MAPVKKPATYADIEALPEHLNGEIVNGELVVSPRPRFQHGHAEGRIYSHLDSRLGGGSGGGWWFVIEPELHLGQDVLIPDVAGWRREQPPADPDTVGMTVVPDWVCEVLSPSTAKVDRAWKGPAYARHGVGHMWIVDPVTLLLEVYRRQEDQWLVVGLYSDDARACIEPFGVIELDLSAWWLPRPPGSAAEAPIIWSSAG